MLANEPPLILVSNKFTSLITTEPSLSNFLKISVSPGCVLRYLCISIIFVDPSPINVGISALGFVATLESQLGVYVGSSILIGRLAPDR